MVLYKDIYQKAVNLFDDPDINRAYVQNKVRFAKLMYPHLDNGIQKFQNPTAITWLLNDRTAPYGEMEIGKGSEITDNTYVLSSSPYENSDFSVMVNKEYVYNYSVEKNDNGQTIVVFEDIVFNPDDEIVIEWYSAGQFNTDFSGATAKAISASLISAKVSDILARALVLAWAEKNKNFILEIRNILTDNDFKIYSPANAINSKVNWVKNLQFEFDTMQNKLSWDLFSVSRNAGGYYGA